MNIRFAVALLFVFAAMIPEVHASKKWRTKENCTLIEHPSNDGDSFRVRIGRRIYVLRLLWVDAPETDMRFPERVAEQAEYFGISTQEVLRIGQEASRFTREFLKSRPFTVYTQFEDARGAGEKERDYAIVKSGDTYLMEALVSNGLARIYGMQEMPPEGPSESTMRMRLRALESAARDQRRGAWALASRGFSPGDPRARLQPLEAGWRTLTRTVPVYAVEDPARMLGMLRAGTEIEILRTESPADVRIRFRLPDGRMMEAIARRADLGW
ncbi:MAG: thermonuclease family protein [Kiritimatiellae bacterium]|nr:thermonuclease family protein [Kiritimatiellia bacterium]MDW8457966.1 thermonuclease family protein [Verrucomicrobiota bacterium]